MIQFLREFVAFTRGSACEIIKGNLLYYAWVALLIALIVWGGLAYFQQYDEGLIVTAMRDQVSWGFYIGNFTFLVGVAAAAIMLVIPAYVYHWKPIREIVIIGELLAIAAIFMCLLFVTADMGRPDRFLHLLTALNFPTSMLAWDVVVLNGYFVLNLFIVTYLLYKAFCRKDYSKKLVLPLVLLSIPAAVSIHTVTAFIYSGIPARHFWNSAILAPRFLASAFCSGPAVLLLTLQIIRKVAGLDLKDEAFRKVAELMAYAMFINLFLFSAEIFTAYYSGTDHLLHFEYLFFGLNGKTGVSIYTWISMVCSISAFFLFLIPGTRNHFPTMNLGCVLIFIGVYIEKGMGLVIPGFTPDTLGEIYEYVPTITEWRIGIGIFAAGFLLYTLMVKVATPIALGTFYYDPEGHSRKAGQENPVLSP
ncbi:MAG: sulfate reduction electron transfer complex DsrMKJOP subunit DsrP [Planctomycetota bacterium]|jgi:molybdopterin-containing oxidoreductase family membrane subunit